MSTSEGTGPWQEEAPAYPVRALRDTLAEVIRGEVRFDAQARALWAADASNYRQVPIGVVLPSDIQDVVATHAVCRMYGAPLLSRGGGTSLAGQCCNAAVVMDFSKHMNRVLQVDAQGRRARVEPGTILDDLRREAQRYGLTFGPDPATHTHCTLGGMLGNNSCGVHSVLSEFYGPGARTDQNVAELEILTYDGERMRVGPTADGELERIIQAGGRRGQIYRDLRDLRDRYAPLIRARFPDIPRRVSGYNLPALLPEGGFNVASALVGTEGTCVTILEASLHLSPHLGHRSLLVIGYPSVCEAGDHIPEIRALRPVGCEGMDDRLIEDIRRKGLHARYLDMLPEGGGWLLVEFGADSAGEAGERAHSAMEGLARLHHDLDMRVYDDRGHQEGIWALRESGLGATAFVPGQPDTWPGWEDSAVPPEQVGTYLRALRDLLDRYGLHGALYGHFAQGCVHSRINFELHTPEGIETYRSFTRHAADLALGFGGSLSGEHGDGQAREELLPLMFGNELMEAFAAFKTVWDPDGRMNPGKAIGGRSRTEDLRLGPAYQPQHPQTHFSFPEDGGSFQHATVRCVGVGKCRRTEGGTMCPSYMVTREEKDTTRGRAHLLFEMLRGEVIQDGWKSEEVKDSLDLCLACKGCKSDCPVNVDIATYKAEFLSHYYEGRLRPREAYALGYIHRWAEIASVAPGLVNLVTQTPGLAHLVRLAANVAAARNIPMFARTPFTRWFRRRRRATPRGRKRVVLWPDTFNNYFSPGTLAAALEVLEAAGFEVIVPERHVCCGRPLYDYGLLDDAKRLLLHTLDVLRPEIEAGTPVVGLEPSCVATFRDELRSILPDRADGRRLAERTFTLGELVDQHTGGWRPPALERKAILHGHCHHKAIMGLDSDRRVLERMQLDFEVLDSGCCGMAGSFGYESGKYDVSMAIGERVLLPAVRAAEEDTIIIADGFSCREQIVSGSDRHGLHLAEVLQLALHPEALDGVRPELAPELLRPQELGPASPRAAVMKLAGAAVAGAVAYYVWRKLM